MRGTIPGSAVLGIVVLTAAPALACSTLTPRACVASGGAFTHRGQVNTCTVTTTARQTTGPSAAPPAQITAGPITALFEGQAQDVLDVTTTTTRTQRGRGPITTATSSTTTIVERQWLSCHVSESFEGGGVAAGYVDPDVCGHPQDFSLTGLLF